MTVTADPEYLALVRAMRAAPDDDVPRLVLADWLEEHGEGARAELVRVQCRAATLQSKDRELPDHTAADGNCPLCYEMVACVRRERELLTPANAAAWYSLPGGPRYGRVIRPTMPAGGWGDVNEHGTPNFGRFETWGWWPAATGHHGIAPPDRGFVGAVECPAEWWLAHGDAVYAAQPVTRVVLTTDPQPALDLWWREWIRRWPGVEFALPPRPRTPTERFQALADTLAGLA